MKKVILYSLILTSLLSCMKNREKETIDSNSSTKAHDNSVITSDDKPSNMISDEIGLKDILTFNKLFNNLPMPTSFIVRKGVNSYIGTFYIGNNGIEEAVFESSGYKIIVNSVDITDTLMTVNFSLLDTGNEEKEATGEVFIYVFKVALSELISAYEKSENRLRMEVHAEEMGKSP